MKVAQRSERLLPDCGDSSVFSGSALTLLRLHLSLAWGAAPHPGRCRESLGCLKKGERKGARRPCARGGAGDPGVFAHIHMKEWEGGVVGS